jgi:N-acetyl-anhydromuramyl-L-alanine amidase AmpD
MAFSLNTIPTHTQRGFEMEIVQVIMPTTCYNNESTKKTQIVLHWTAGSYRPDYVVSGWEAAHNRIATHFVVGGVSGTGDKAFDGKIYQAIPQAKWAWHLGIPGADNNHGSHDKSSIGIETCLWGGLTKTVKGEYINYVHQTVPVSQVVKLDQPYRGYLYYHEPSDAQIQSLRVLILSLAQANGIVLDKGRVFTATDFEKDIAKASTKAVAFHSSFRSDKVDWAPMPKLIQMLNEIHA